VFRTVVNSENFIANFIVKRSLYKQEFVIITYCSRDVGVLGFYNEIQGDQKVCVHLMLTIQKVTSNVQSVPRQSPDIY
jgi:hypothetical protein